MADTHTFWCVFRFGHIVGVINKCSHECIVSHWPEVLLNSPCNPEFLSWKQIKLHLKSIEMIKTCRCILMFMSQYILCCSPQQVGTWWDLFFALFLSAILFLPLFSFLVESSLIFLPYINLINHLVFFLA